MAEPSFDDLGLIEVVSGKACSISRPTGNVAAIGRYARAHTSAYIRECLAFGSLCLAETDGQSPAIAVGCGAKAVAHADTETALAIGYGVEAVCKGKDGKAIAISMGDEACVVSAAEGGRLIIVATTLRREYESTFVADIDGNRFVPGVRYTVDEQTGEWSAVGEDDDPFADVEEPPESQVEEAMARALAL